IQTSPRLRARHRDSTLLRPASALGVHRSVKHGTNQIKQTSLSAGCRFSCAHRTSDCSRTPGTAWALACHEPGRLCRYSDDYPVAAIRSPANPRDFCSRLARNWSELGPNDRLPSARPLDKKALSVLVLQLPEWLSISVR